MRKIVSAALAATLALAIVVTLAIVSLRSDARTRPYAPASVDTLELMKQTKDLPVQRFDAF